MKRFGVAVHVMLAAVVACGGDAPRKADSTVFIDVVDINARDTVPTPPPSRIGRIQLLSEPVGGTCKVTKLRGAGISREITYYAESPRRTITLGVGSDTRAFPAISLQIMGVQGDGESTEQEFLVVGFSADGSVNAGSRNYSSTGPNAASEKVALSPADSRDAISFAQRLLALCAEPSR